MSSPMNFIDHFNHQIHLMDSKYLYFGHSDDITMKWDGTDFHIDGVAASVINIGVDGAGHDVKIFGATSGCYFEWDESADRLNITRTSAATTGTLRSLSISQTMTATSTANIVEALNVTITSNVKTGAWANAIVGSINYSTAGAAHGMAAGICAEMIPPNGSLVRGALYALDCEIGPGASSTWASAGPVAYIKFSNWGTKAHFDDNGFLFHLDGATAGSAHLYSTAANAATGDATLKIRVGTATKYILLSDDNGA